MFFFRRSLHTSLHTSFDSSQEDDKSEKKSRGVDMLKTRDKRTNSDVPRRASYGSSNVDILPVTLTSHLHSRVTEFENAKGGERKSADFLPIFKSYDVFLEEVWNFYKLLCWGAELTSFDVNGPDPTKTLLEILLEKADPWLLHMFVIHGSELDVVNESTGDTLLHFAAKNNLYECLDVLFTYVGREVSNALNAKNNDGDTPLDVARACSSFRVIEVLVGKDEALAKKKESEQKDEVVVDGSKSPRTSQFMEDPEKQNVVKRMINKATGHNRTKSAFAIPPNMSEGKEGRDAQGKVSGPFGRLLPKREKGSHVGRQPVLSSKPSMNEEDEDEPTSSTSNRLSAGPRKAVSAGKLGTSERDHIVGSSVPIIPQIEEEKETSLVRRSESTQEVHVRQGKAPLMKGKGLDQNAIKEALVQEDVVRDVVVHEETADDKIKKSDSKMDLMGFISENDTEDDEEESEKKEN